MKVKRWSKIYGAREDKVLILENLSLLLRAGISISEALRSLNKEIGKRSIRRRIDYIIDAIENGSPLWRPMSEVNMFPHYAISLIKIGESSGTLSDNLMVLSKTTKRVQTLRQNIVSAVTYPVFVVAVTFLVGIGITWTILPRLADLFSGMGSDLPFITKVLLQFGSFVESDGAWFLPTLVIIFGIAFYFIFVYRATRLIGQKLLLLLPGTKRVIVQTEVSKLGLLGSSLLSAGIPIGDLFESLQDITNNYYYKKFYKAVSKEIVLGNKIYDSVIKADKRSRLVPQSVKSLIGAGEDSGSLAEAFLYVGESYQSKAEHSTKILSTLLEPVLLVIVWFGVLLLAVAIILPIYNVVGDFGQSPDELLVEEELPQNLINRQPAVQ